MGAWRRCACGGGLLWWVKGEPGRGETGKGEYGGMWEGGVVRRGVVRRGVVGRGAGREAGRFYHVRSVRERAGDLDAAEHIPRWSMDGAE